MPYQVYCFGVRLPDRGPGLGQANPSGVDAADGVPGPLSPNSAAVLHIKSGDTVTINTVNGVAAKTQLPSSPRPAFRQGYPAGRKHHQQYADKGLWLCPSRRQGPWTGPIYIDGAEPGDKLEIRIFKVTPRAPYGVNNVGNTGGFPGMLPGITREQGTHIIRYDIAKKIVNFAPDIHFRRGLL